MKHALPSWLEAWERKPSLRDPDRLRERIDVIDRLEDGLIERADQSEDADLHRRATALCEELEAINRGIYRDIRRDILQRGLSNAWTKWVPSSLFHDTETSHVSGERYDYLDALLNGVLSFPAPGEAIASLSPEMVFYQPTPARHIFDMLQRVRLEESDVLIDLGSGMGHVPLLAAICSRARCVGIELEPIYVACAQQCATALNLARTRFIAQDVRSADLSEGTVFYLYTPFTGTIWRSVMNRLKKEAEQRSIRLCTLGPCTSLIAEEPWLEASGTMHADRVAVLRSR